MLFEDDTEIFIEIPQRCELCGIIDITRPYGLNHEEICRECAENDEAVTIIRMNEYPIPEDMMK
jgi:hypothetical protein